MRKTDISDFLPPSLTAVFLVTQTASRSVSSNRRKRPSSLVHCFGDTIIIKHSSPCPRSLNVVNLIAINKHSRLQASVLQRYRKRAKSRSKKDLIRHLPTLSNHVTRLLLVLLFHERVLVPTCFS